MDRSHSEAEFSIRAILYEDRPDKEPLPPGSSGVLTVSADGLTWRAGRLGGHHHDPMVLAWADIFRVRILVVVRGLSKLIELRTSRGAHWLSVAIDDELAVREVLTRHVEDVEEGPLLGEL